MKFKVKVLLFLTTLMVASGCSSIVKHPEIDHVKRVGIVSLSLDREFLNRSSSNTSGGSGAAQIGAYSGFLKKGLNAINNDKTTPANPEETDNRIRIAQIGLDKFTEGFKRVPGWEIVPAAQIVASDEYKELVKLGSFKTPPAPAGPTGALAAMAGDLLFVAPKGMTPLPIDSDHMNHMKEAVLLKIMKKFNLQGIASIHFTVGHSGVFPGVYRKPQIATSVQLINNRNERAIVFPETIKGEWIDGPTNVLGVGGAMLPTKETEDAVSSAIQASVQHIVGVIVRGIRDN